MSGPIKFLNQTRPTICGDCLNFRKEIDPIYKSTMCSYYDKPTAADNDTKCLEYTILGDPI